MIYFIIFFNIALLGKNIKKNEITDSFKDEDSPVHLTFNINHNASNNYQAEKRVEQNQKVYTDINKTISFLKSTAFSLKDFIQKEGYRKIFGGFFATYIFYKIFNSISKIKKKLNELHEKIIEPDSFLQISQLEKVINIDNNWIINYIMYFRYYEEVLTNSEDKNILFHRSSVKAINKINEELLRLNIYEKMYRKYYYFLFLKYTKHYAFHKNIEKSKEVLLFNLKKIASLLNSSYPRTQY